MGNCGCTADSHPAWTRIFPITGKPWEHAHSVCQGCEWGALIRLKSWIYWNRQWGTTGICDLGLMVWCGQFVTYTQVKWPSSPCFMAWIQWQNSCNYAPSSGVNPHNVAHSWIWDELLCSFLWWTLLTIMADLMLHQFQSCSLTNGLFPWAPMWVTNKFPSQCTNSFHCSSYHTLSGPVINLLVTRPYD